MDPQSLVDYAASLDCIHCGLCLRTCPTYQLTGAESSSPRGRIYMMRAVAEGALPANDPTYREELDFCLVCRHCESVCPAGVRFGEMMEVARDSSERAHARTILVRLARWLGLGVVLPSRWWTARAMDLLFVAQRTGLARLAARCLPRAAGSLAHFPKVPTWRERRRWLSRPETTAGERPAAVLLEGCVMPELFAAATRASAQVLEACGRRVLTSSSHACCGALHAHNGDLKRARELATQTIERLDALAGDSTPIVVPSAGCSAHMKAYGKLLEDDPVWSKRASNFARRVADFSEFVARELPAQVRLEVAAGVGRVTYDDACHLCHGQGVRTPPRQLLDRVHGLQRVELEGSEDCCGSAGIYSLLRPADSQAIFERKWIAFQATGASVLVTANPGCQLQWHCGLARHASQAQVLHLSQVLAAALPTSPGA